MLITSVISLLRKQTVSQIQHSNKDLSYSTSYMYQFILLSVCTCMSVCGCVHGPKCMCVAAQLSSNLLTNLSWNQSVLHECCLTTLNHLLNLGTSNNHLAKVQLDYSDTNTTHTYTYRYTYCIHIFAINALRTYHVITLYNYCSSYQHTILFEHAHFYL